MARSRRAWHLAPLAALLMGCGQAAIDPVAVPVESSPTLPDAPPLRTATSATSSSRPSAISSTTASAAAATVAEPAKRSVQWSTTGACDLVTVEALAARHPGVHQFVVMATDSFDATWGTSEVAVWADGAWRCQVGPQQARFGRTGTRQLIERRSGDGTTPAGVFALGTVRAWDGQVFQMFGNAPDPGVQASYRDVRPEDCWGATPNTARYQHLVNLPNCPGPDDEDLERIAGVYAHAAVIGANLDPISGDQPGEIPYAAAIFLHRHNYGGGATSGTVRPTSGCVSLAQQALVDTLRVLDPDLAPHFAIGPLPYLRNEA